MLKRYFSKLALVAALFSGGSVMATTIDFESTAVGTYSSLNFSPVTISFLAGNGAFDVTNQVPAPDPLLSGHMLISFFTNPGPGSFQAIFGGGASSVSINVADFTDSDEDIVHLRAYDSLNNLLDSDSFLIPGTGPGTTLTVSSGSPIARVEWNETGDFEGAVFWDNLTFTAAQAVPEPATLALLSLGLAGLGFSRRKNA